MNEKRKCPRCGLLIDSTLPSCPYCGEHFKESEDKVVAEVIEEKKEETKKEKHSIFKFPTRVINVPVSLNLTLFLLGLIGLQFIAFFLSLIGKSLNPYLMGTDMGSGYLNFACYFISFGIFLLVIKDYFKDFLTPFKKGRSYLIGISYGFLLIVVSLIVSNLMSLIFKSNSENNNQSSINSIASTLPILSLIVFGIIGPIVEEMTYRVGLFGLLKKKSTALAYILVPIVFGFIHFDFSSISNPSLLANELINIPSYIVSGLLLSYYYDKEGFGASSVAHITNNVFSILLTIIVSRLS